MEASTSHGDSLENLVRPSLSTGQVISSARNKYLELSPEANGLKHSKSENKIIFPFTMITASYFCRIFYFDIEASSFNMSCEVGSVFTSSFIDES